MEVPYLEIAPDTLAELIQVFVLREGTDYGQEEATLSRKLAEVRAQLDRGEAKIVFDLMTETCSIVTKK